VAPNVKFFVWFLVIFQFWPTTINVIELSSSYHPQLLWWCHHHHHCIAIMENTCVGFDLLVQWQLYCQHIFDMLACTFDFVKDHEMMQKVIWSSYAKQFCSCWT
jgi:hypothetical protein